MEKSRGSMMSRLKAILESYDSVNEDLFDELEEMFIMADIGVNTVIELTIVLKLILECENC